MKYCVSEERVDILKQNFSKYTKTIKLYDSVIARYTVGLILEPVARYITDRLFYYFFIDMSAATSEIMFDELENHLNLVLNEIGVSN
jgi:hypothetical protein